jgi:hypothetical protein
LKFSEMKFSKVNNNKIQKLYNEFENYILENSELYIKKDYLNFREYCLNIISK